MDIVSLVIQVISGVVGGNAAGMSKQSMGPLLNSIFGGVGGVIVGQILAAITGEPGAGMGAGGSLDMAAIISSIVGGGAGGAVLTFVAGFIKSKMQAR
ncbi:MULTISPECIES: hypothetical protein [Pseudomonas]|uniref:hypothetical protein n=1 Tax=Pseudomonas TaxID=286 RepID=UPI00072FD939|nr:MULTISPECIES: hypothetical protein [Pseudomonas]KTC24788.1 DNA methyltransferase [Pseudomonas putida]MCO7506254.1 hypothetical protein [Pseudomonas sp. VE 267-6A]MCO7530942.1 hypothetical protein [Pseudomonas sp. 2]MEC6746117.1 hypothetical protein [Pseudomonas qingdaonensis]UVL49015.1 hypothetical protein LOY33_13510 [Pseudomonas sp. B21-036]